MKTKINCFVLALFLVVLSGCQKDDGGPVTDSIYSGTGNFNFSGDYNESYSGSVQSTQVSSANGIELLPLSFIDGQGRELFIGLKSTRLESRAYDMKNIDSEGYAVFEFPTGLYDTGAIGGNGTVTITTINGATIKGSVNLRLARPLNTADTVIVMGSFQLKSK